MDLGGGCGAIIPAHLTISRCGGEERQEAIEAGAPAGEDRSLPGPGA